MHLAAVAALLAGGGGVDVPRRVKSWDFMGILLGSIDWFKGKITGKSHDLHGKIYAFRLRFSLFCQPIEGSFRNVNHGERLSDQATQ